METRARETVLEEQTFERLRPRLFRLAYRMLGTVDDADDVVQTAWVRWHDGGAETALSPEAWLVAVTTRLAIDRLRQVKAERERYVGSWLPEPVATGSPAAHAELERAAELSTAFLVMLERLAPAERAAFLLHEVLGAGYGEIAAVLRRSEAACRQVVHRARERVRDARARFDVPDVAKQRLVARFLAGIAAQDEAALLAVVAEDAEWIADGGGKAFVARGLRGAARIARFLLSVARKGRGATRRDVAWVNGEPAVLTWIGDRLFSVIAFATDGERIVRFYAVVNPDKLRRLAASLGPGGAAARPGGAP